METFIVAYLITGAILGLVVLWASFHPDFDPFVKDFFREEPPTTSEKIVTVCLSLFLWPLYLWYAFK